jgi:hypothetical protein
MSELSGKVIIFDSEEEAKMWFKTIEDVNYCNKVESKRLEFEGFIKRNDENS